MSALPVTSVDLSLHGLNCLSRVCTADVSLFLSFSHSLFVSVSLSLSVCSLCSQKKLTRKPCFDCCHWKTA